MMNKWWDGFQGQKIVILEDYDPTCLEKVSGHDLKIWTDRYPFLGEVKGASAYIHLSKFIITSQYRLDDCFPFCPKLSEALHRRFQEIQVTKENRDRILPDSMIIIDDEEPMAIKEEQNDDSGYSIAHGIHHSDDEEEKDEVE